MLTAIVVILLLANGVLCVACCVAAGRYDEAHGMK